MSGERILVIDDEPDVRLTVKVVLEVSGYDVIEAENGHRGLERADEMPDAIILDLRLPDMDGADVLATLKADAAVAQIPVICLSAHSDTATKHRMSDRGAAAYVSKPFEIDALRSTLRAVLDARRRAS